MGHHRRDRHTGVGGVRRTTPVGGNLQETVATQRGGAKHRQAGLERNGLCEMVSPGILLPSEGECLFIMSIHVPHVYISNQYCFPMVQLKCTVHEDREPRVVSVDCFWSGRLRDSIQRPANPLGLEDTADITDSEDDETYVPEGREETDEPSSDASIEWDEEDEESSLNEEDDPQPTQKRAKIS